jgi:hypothetical protein
VRQVALDRDQRRERGVVETQFTFLGKSDRIEVRIVEAETCYTASESDSVWLDSTVTIQAGAFVGSFKAYITIDDLTCLQEQLKQALTSQGETVSFQNTGGGLALSINLESGEQISITGVAHPNRLREGILVFRMDTDHFALIHTLRELENALREFPPTRTREQEKLWS